MTGKVKKKKNNKRVRDALFKYSEEICKEAVEVSNDIINSFNPKKRVA